MRPLRLDVQPTDMRLSQDEEDAVYRIVQESVTNAIRHGHATEIDVHLSCQERRMTIVVQDNGIGCAKIEQGFGLRHYAGAAAAARRQPARKWRERFPDRGLHTASMGG